MKFTLRLTMVAASIATLSCFGTGMTPTAAADIQEYSSNYKVNVRGFPVGEFVIAGRTDGNSYAASAVVVATGVLSWFTDIKVRGKVRGWVGSDQLLPYRYRGELYRGGKTTNYAVNFADGRVESAVTDPPDETAVDLSSDELSNAIDPLTILFLTFIPAERSKICVGSYDIFDGKRFYSFVFEPGLETELQLSCTGRYFLHQGFEDNEFADENPVVNMVYQRDTDGNLYKLKTAAAKARVGVVSIERLTGTDQRVEEE